MAIVRKNVGGKTPVTKVKTKVEVEDEELEDEVDEIEEDDEEEEVPVKKTSKKAPVKGKKAPVVEDDEDEEEEDDEDEEEEEEAPKKSSKKTVAPAKGKKAPVVEDDEDEEEEDDEDEEEEEEAPKKSSKKTVAPAKGKTKEAPAKSGKKAPAKKSSNLPEIGELGSVVRDDVLKLIQNELVEVGYIESTEDIKLTETKLVLTAVENVFREILENNNTVTFAGKQISRKKISGRIYATPISEYAYLTMPHYKMLMTFEESDAIKGNVDKKGNFVSVDKKVKMSKDELDKLNAKFKKA